MKTILLHFFLKYKGNHKAILKALETHEKVSFKRLTEIEDRLKNYVTILDHDYPEEFKETSEPPVIFRKGARYTIKLSFNPAEPHTHEFDGGIYQKERDGE